MGEGIVFLIQAQPINVDGPVKSIGDLVARTECFVGSVALLTAQAVAIVVNHDKVVRLFDAGLGNTDTFLVGNVSVFV